MCLPAVVVHPLFVVLSALVFYPYLPYLTFACLHMPLVLTNLALIINPVTCYYSTCPARKSPLAHLNHDSRATNQLLRCFLSLYFLCPVFQRSMLREFLLTKLINAEISCYKAQQFSRLEVE